MAVDRVVLETHRRQLGKELVGQAGVDEEPQPGRRVIDHHQLVEFVADAFRRHDLQPRGDARTAATTSGSDPARTRR